MLMKLNRAALAVWGASVYRRQPELFVALVHTSCGVGTVNVSVRMLKWNLLEDWESYAYGVSERN
jgi:hypothetical protein